MALSFSPAHLGQGAEKTSKKTKHPLGKKGEVPDKSDQPWMADIEISLVKKGLEQPKGLKEDAKNFFAKPKKTDALPSQGEFYLQKNKTFPGFHGLSLRENDHQEGDLNLQEHQDEKQVLDQIDRVMHPPINEKTFLENPKETKVFHGEFQSKPLETVDTDLSVQGRQTQQEKTVTPGKIIIPKDQEDAPNSLALFNGLHKNKDGLKENSLEAPEKAEPQAPAPPKIVAETRPQNIPLPKAAFPLPKEIELITAKEESRRLPLGQKIQNSMDQQPPTEKMTVAQPALKQEASFSNEGKNTPRKAFEDSGTDNGAIQDGENETGSLTGTSFQKSLDEEVFPSQDKPQDMKITPFPKGDSSKPQAIMAEGKILSSMDETLESMNFLSIKQPTFRQSGRLELSLHPAHLGKVDVQVVLQEDGRLTATVHAHEQEGYQVLSIHRHELEQTITKAFDRDLKEMILEFDMNRDNSDGKHQNKQNPTEFQQNQTIPWQVNEDYQGQSNEVGRYKTSLGNKLMDEWA